MQALRARLLATVPAAGLVLLTSAAAHAEPFRATVVVPKPIGLASTLATNMTIDASARAAMADAYLRERLSPVLVRRRGEAVREALDPLTTLLGGFTVVSRTDVAGDRVRVVCQADVDTADVTLRLVEHGVLSFGRSAPRVLLVPAPGTSVPAFQALRAQMGDTLRGAGVTILEADPEAATTADTHAADGARLTRAAIDAGAHFVALLGVTAVRAPSPGSVVILDGSIQFTVRRVYDAAVVDEQAFSTREGAGSTELALGRVIGALGPAAARALAGSITRALFANGRVVDASRRTDVVTLNVTRRTGAAATAALLALLKERGYAAALGTGASTMDGGVTRERITIGGGATVEEIFLLLAGHTFGPADELSASIFEHGVDSLGLELLDATAQPQHEPIASVALVVALEESGQASRAPGGGSIQQGPKPGGPPAPPGRERTGPPAKVERVAMGAAAATPLEFEFSAAFAEAMTAGKSTGK